MQKSRQESVRYDAWVSFTQRTNASLLRRVFVNRVCFSRYVKASFKVFLHMFFAHRDRVLNSLNSKMAVDSKLAAVVVVDRFGMVVSESLLLPHGGDLK